MNLDQYLTPHFTLREMCKSDTADRHGIDNTPPEEMIHRLRALCANILEPCRSQFGPIKVNSGWRGPELNKLVNGSPNSQHCKAEAADFEAVRNAVSNFQLAEWIMMNLEFDQLILECWRPGDPHAGWVHCSIGPRERNEVLTYQRGAGYTKGLPR